jgi:hypothetical protein
VSKVWTLLLLFNSTAVAAEITSTELMAVDWYGYVLRVDLGIGRYERVGRLETPDGVAGRYYGLNALAQSPNGALWTVGSDKYSPVSGFSSPSSDILISFDPLTLQHSSVRISGIEVPTICSMTYLRGRLYAMNMSVVDKNVVTSLYAIDKKGHAKFVSNITGNVQNLTSDQHDLWMLSDKGLATIDPKTGVLTDRFPNKFPASNLQSLDFAPDGMLYGVGVINRAFGYYKINPATEEYTYIPMQKEWPSVLPPPDIRGLEWVSYDIPEPSCVLLLSLLFMRKPRWA